MQKRSSQVTMELIGVVSLICRLSLIFQILKISIKKKGFSHSISQDIVFSWKNVPNATATK